MDFDAPLGTVVDGTLTNTGTTTGSFAVELQANTGETGVGIASVVPPGQTAHWGALFHGAVTARILRTTMAPPPP